MLIPFGLALLMSLPSLFTNDTSLNINTANYLRNPNSMASGWSLVTALFSCLVCLFAIPAVLIAGWYNYEATQSGIQSRPTKALWEGNFGDKLKKSLKYLAAALVYVLVIGIIVSIISGIFFFAIAILTGGAFSTTDLATARGMGNLSGLYILLVCLFGFVFVGIMIVLSVLSYFTVTPGLLRLVATNSFGEAFRLKDNWNLAMRHKGELLGMYLVSSVAITLITIIGGFGGAFAGAFSLISPVLYMIVMFVINYINTLLTTYFSYFFYPRFSGLVFRDIINSDPSLSYVPLKGEAK